VQLIRDRRARRVNADPFRGIVHVDQSVCYDLLASLLVLYSPRMFPSFRHWSAAARKLMPADLWEEGRSFFQGQERCVGFGVVRMIPDLPHPSTPATLLSALRRADVTKTALYMLEGPGGLSSERLEAFEKLLAGGKTQARVRAAMRGLSPARKTRFEAVLKDPKGEKDRLVRFISGYLDLVFKREADRLAAPLREAAKLAHDTLAVLPSADAIERVTGGYTLSTELSLARIIVAPSAFLYPAVACRIDERKAEAFILYGVASPHIEGSDSSAALGGGVMIALRALSDPNRLQILRLVSERPRLTSELVAKLALSQPAVHHHIRELWAAELVRQERTRNGMLCAIREDGVRRVIGALSDLVDAEGAHRHAQAVVTTLRRGGRQESPRVQLR